jgi:eukaryotic-like serine/threonine-protein kinase
MLRPDGVVKVLDFGLAKVIQSDSSTEVTEAPTITEAGYVMGTVKYMSPEQVRGLPVDARSDIFSLGIVVYEMLAGVGPFEGQTGSDSIAAILEKDPLPMANHSADVSDELELIVSKMLRKDREDRYQTAKELLNDLRLFKHKQQVSSDVIRSGPAKTKKTFSIRLHEISSKFVFGTLAIILLLVLSFYQLKKATGNINSIAVLPLVNVGKQTEMEYLTDGITEIIIRSLSQLPNFRVMAQSTVFRYKRREVDPQTVGRELGVRAVMTGRVIQNGDNLLITIELADARNNSYIWSHQYHGKTADLLSIQSEIATDISERLRLRLSGKEKELLAKGFTDNVEAYQLYLKGLYFWNKRSKEGIDKGISYFHQALETDPAYALAWSGLADSYIALAFYEYAAPKDAMPKVRAAAMRALAIDESLAEAQTSLAHVAVNFDWDWAASEKIFKKAIQLNPNYPVVHQWYGTHYLTPIARFNEALAEVKRAQELDPLSPLRLTFVGATFYFARQYQEAERQCKKALELESNFPVTHWHLGLIYEQMGNYEQAISEHKKAIEFSGGSPRLVAALGHAYAIAGMREEAMQVITQLNQHDYVSPLELAAIHVGLGEKEKAIELLEKAYNDRSFHLTYLKVRQDFDPIRNDTRFADLIRRIGLVP